jgi:hypothetical protein
MERLGDVKELSGRRLSDLRKKYRSTQHGKPLAVPAKKHA